MLNNNVTYLYRIQEKINETKNIIITILSANYIHVDNLDDTVSEKKTPLKIQLTHILYELSINH